VAPPPARLLMKPDAGFSQMVATGEPRGWSPASPRRGHALARAGFRSPCADIVRSAPWAPYPRAAAGRAAIVRGRGHAGATAAGLACTVHDILIGTHGCVGEVASDGGNW